MKRSQVEEENCGHWEFEVLHSTAPSEGGTLQPSSMLRNSGTTPTRRLRFRASGRDLTAGMTLVRMTGRADETHNVLPQRAGTDVPALVTTEQEYTRRVSLTEVGTSEKPIESCENNGSVMGDGYDVLDTTEDPMFDVHEGPVPETEASTRSVVDEIRQAITPDSLLELVSGAVTDEPLQDYGEDDRDKENRDPLGHWAVLPHRSPLPEWFPRKPLQDITNVLACDLVRYLINSESL